MELNNNLSMFKNRNKKIKIAIILGTRPNFVKVAPFLKEAKKHPEFIFTLIHTGQHFDKNMSDTFFEKLGIPDPEINLNIHGGFHTERIGRTFNALKKILIKRKFNAIIVFGDVNSTLAGGIAATGNTRIIHIEAGLRSHDRRMPEEINRVVVDHLADLLFTTEPSANENLVKEGIAKKKIKYVGNIMIESIEIFWEKIKKSYILKDLSLFSRKYVLATIHRQENTDNKQSLKKILMILNEINKKLPVVFPLHPGTKNKIKEYGLGDLLKKIKIISPLGYFEFMNLIVNSKGVVTDSGGIQEETTYLGIPCCTLRDNTERPITLTSGSNKLFPIDLKILTTIMKHLNRHDFKQKNIPFWDDKVSERIFKVLIKEYFKNNNKKI